MYSPLHEQILFHVEIYTVKWVLFTGFYFRYIRDLLMEREFNTPIIIAKLYCTYCEVPVHINCLTANLRPPK